MDVELDFLITSVKVIPTMTQLDRIATLCNSLDTEKLISLSMQHGILPLVYHRLKQLNLVNSETLLKFKERYTIIAQDNMRMTAELFRIIRLLEQNGIQALAFKGPSLSHIAYGDITLRQFGDLDILVHPKDRQRVFEVLTAADYLPEFNMPLAFLDDVNVAGLYRKSSGILIEIHWALLSGNYAVKWDENRLWKSWRNISLNHHEIAVILPEQHLLYLCIHGAKHIFERIEWICDIDRFVRAHSQLQWKEMTLQARQMGVMRMFLLGLALSHKFLDTPLPEEIKSDINKDEMIEELLFEILHKSLAFTVHSGKTPGYFKMLLQMRERLSDKVLTVWYGIVRPTVDDFKYILLPRRLFFLYALIRPYRLIRKYL